MPLALHAVTSLATCRNLLLLPIISLRLPSSRRAHHVTVFFIPLPLLLLLLTTRNMLFKVSAVSKHFLANMTSKDFLLIVLHVQSISTLPLLMILESFSIVEVLCTDWASGCLSSFGGHIC
jgi:hypothetical protein